MYELSVEAIESALFSIAPTDRDVWIRMGMAVKNELGDGGFELWDRWSQQAGNYQYKAAQSAWRSFKIGFGPTLGSLIYEAKQNGWQPDQDFTKKTPQEIERQIAQWRALQAEQEQERLLTSEQVSQRATAELNHATAASRQHPYLVKKGIGPHGLRLSKQGDLLVPAQDIQGQIWTLQRIKADGTKLFSKGGKKLGCFYWIGPQGTQLSRTQDILLCEGFATGASLYEALAKPVVVCFDAGNLLPVAKAVRQVYPLQRIILAADNDQYTDTNTGQLKAAAVRSTVDNVFMALPQFEDVTTRPTDFNDLHQLKGLEAVRQQVLNHAGGPMGHLNNLFDPRSQIRWLLNSRLKHKSQLRMICLILFEPLLAQVLTWPKELDPEMYPAFRWPAHILQTQKALQIPGTALLRALEMDERKVQWLSAAVERELALLPLPKEQTLVAQEAKAQMDWMKEQVRELSRRVKVSGQG